LLKEIMDEMTEDDERRGLAIAMLKDAKTTWRNYAGVVAHAQRTVKQQAEARDDEDELNGIVQVATSIATSAANNDQLMVMFVFVKLAV
jgi:hypothetical protein